MVWDRPHRQLEKGSKGGALLGQRGLCISYLGHGLARVWERDKDQRLRVVASKKTCVPWVSTGPVSVGSGEWNGAAGRLRVESAPEPRAAWEGVKGLRVSPRGAQRWLSGCGQSCRGLRTELERSMWTCKQDSLLQSHSRAWSDDPRPTEIE